MLNHITLMGRLVRDPELRHTTTGTAVASFTLAVDRDFTNQSGQRECDFIDIVAWRGSAEFVSKYFVKGQMAAVTGRLQIREWVDKEGGKRRSSEVIADNIYFADSKKSRESGGGDFRPASDDGARSYGGAAFISDTSSEFSELDDDGDLPF